MNQIKKECAAKLSNPACSDGADNDRDGKRDYPADPGCTSLSGATEDDGRPTPLQVMHQPFAGNFNLTNFFDHDLPHPFTDSNGFLLTSYGEMTSMGDDGHDGLDYAMPEGTEILAAYDGTVEFAGSEIPWVCPLLHQTVSGKLVSLRHTIEGIRFNTLYAHLSQIDVVAGKHVSTGEHLGYSGNTGCSTGPHLHFQVRRYLSIASQAYAVVDPFGWNGAGIDPWAADPSGAESFNLWEPGYEPEEFRYRRLAPNPDPDDTARVAITENRWMGNLDDANPNNEYVELTLDPRYAVSGSVDLTSFTIKTNGGLTYQFPAGFTITNGKPVRVWSGGGTDNSTNLYWGRTSSVWSNNGDCAYLVKPDGYYMYRLYYGPQGCTLPRASSLERSPIHASPDPGEVTCPAR